MLSKAPPVPQPRPSEAPKEQAQNETAEAEVSLPTPEALPAREELPDQAVGDRIVEEQQVSENVIPNPAAVGASRQIPSGASSSQPLHTGIQKPKPEMNVQKPDDRLFTLAAIGLTIAIVVLLLKKFIKSTEHGAVFMDRS